jgi:hypothetical protein
MFVTSAVSTRVVLATIVIFVAACGGGGGGGDGGSGGSATPALTSGQFIDGRVQGIAYSTPTASGVTDSSGTFQFRSGENVTFCLGTITNGACQGFNLGTAAGKFLMQVTDLSAGNSLLEQNKLRLLQALDADNNLSNGIDIAGSVRAAATPLSINFNATTAAFDTAFSGIAGSLQSPLGRLPALPSATAAQAHARRTLACELTGIYRGRYTGNTSASDSGVFEAIIQPNGLIVIRGMSTRDSSRFSGIGSMPTSGLDSFIVGTTSTGATFTGSATSTGLSGSWSNTGQTGTFSATKRNVALPSGATGDVYRGVFSGDDMGAFVLAINSSNNVSGRFFQASDSTEGLLTGIRTGTTAVSGSYPLGTYTATIKNDGKSVFFDGSWLTVDSGVTYTGYAMGCLVGTPSTSPVVPPAATIAATTSAATAGNAFINSGTNSVTGGNGGTISRATIDRVTTQIQTSGTCCIPGTF